MRSQTVELYWVVDSIWVVRMRQSTRPGAGEQVKRECFL